MCVDKSVFVTFATAGLVSRNSRMTHSDVFNSPAIPPAANNHVQCSLYLPSVLWRCWSGGRKGIRPVKNWAVGCWSGYLSGVRCRLAYVPVDATATHCLLLQWNQDWFYGFTFLVPAHLGSPGKRAVKRVCSLYYCWDPKQIWYMLCACEFAA